ncbi:MAG: hypothetical protein KC777_07340 [Cyanobacteria bacterium HKST-UBA02]|nr:hypothetical protein [Cyanobacteria bacterium HKST-UBA02]
MALLRSDLAMVTITAVHQEWMHNQVTILLATVTIIAALRDSPATKGMGTITAIMHSLAITLLVTDITTTTLQETFRQEAIVPATDITTVLPPMLNQV